jgi:hypothetical protein
VDRPEMLNGSPAILEASRWTVCEKRTVFDPGVRIIGARARGAPVDQIPPPTAVQAVCGKNGDSAVTGCNGQPGRNAALQQFLLGYDGYSGSLTILYTGGQWLVRRT